MSEAPSPRSMSDHEIKLAAIKGSRAPESARHPLGLPAGSVRAILAFMVLGLIWILLFLQKEVPLYLQYLMFMILGHYFAIRQKPVAAPDAAEPSPLYLPRGVIRAFIFLGFVGVFASIFYHHRDNLEGLWTEMQSDKTGKQYLPLLLAAAFFVGLLAARVGVLLQNRTGMRSRLQDFQAWLSLMAVVLLAIEVLLQLVINPTLEESKRIQLPHIENFFAAIVGFYFGARS